MSSLLPLASYNLALLPFAPTQAIESDLPVTVHITLAAIDASHPVDDDEEPSTLRILKSSLFNQLGDDSDEDSDDELDADYSDDGDSKVNRDDDDDEVEDADDEEKGSEDDSDDSDDSDSDSEDELNDDVEEYVVCTLSPKSQYQQTLDLTISPEEEVYFVVTGSYPIHITGNYVEHPFDGDEDDYSDEDGLYDEDSDEDYEQDLTPDEDELVEQDFDIDSLEDEEDVEAKIQELVDEDEAEKPKKEEKVSKKEAKKAKKEAKRKAEEVETEDKKQTKKQKQQEKNVQFNKELEAGPTKSGKSKPVTKTLAGGVVIEDRTIGKGPVAKNGSKVGVRYIGKLKNGSVFDKNTSGKPFIFNLGKGEVIKGWDIGVAGMAVGGERRIIIPAPFAYGKKKLPGIPANSELTFDVKLVSLK